MKKTIKALFSFYETNVAVVLPLLLISAVALLADKIPYVNLFADTVVVIVLAINWLVILWISRINTKKMIMAGLFFFLLTYPLNLLKLEWFVNVMANFSYIIFTTAVLFEIMNQVKHNQS